jgi:co-chaperonin GroES (HSP10)
MSENFTLRHAYALLDYIEHPPRKAGSIILSVTEDPELREATIVGVGPGLPDDVTSDLRVGQTVLVHYRTSMGMSAPGRPVTYRALGVSLVRDGRTYYIHGNRDIWLIMEDVERGSLFPITPTLFPITPAPRS